MQVPPGERARLNVTLQCWLGPPPPLGAVTNPDVGCTDGTSSTCSVISATDKGGVVAAITSTVRAFSAWVWSYLSSPTVAGLGAHECLARLGELERQLTLAALANAPMGGVAKHQQSQSDTQLLHAADSGGSGMHGGDTNDERAGIAGMRSSASEPDLHAKQHSRSRARFRSLVAPTASSAADSMLQQQPNAQLLKAPVLTSSQPRAEQCRLEDLHTALRGVLAMYDCAAPQLLQLANEISDSAEIWDALLYR